MWCLGTILPLFASGLPDRHVPSASSSGLLSVCEAAAGDG